MKAKTIYLSDDILQHVQTQIDTSGESFSNFVRNALMYYGDAQPPLPDNNLIEHTNQIACLSNEIHQYTLAIAEKDLYSDCLPDLIVIQNQLEQLIDTETELVKHNKFEKGR